MLRQAGPDGFRGRDAATPPRTSRGTPKRKQPSRWAVRRAQKQQRQERDEQEKIDAILAKVSAHGMNSLTWLEKRTSSAPPNANERPTPSAKPNTAAARGDGITSLAHGVAHA